MKQVRDSVWFFSFWWSVVCVIYRRWQMCSLELHKMALIAMTFAIDRWKCAVLWCNIASCSAFRCTALDILYYWKLLWSFSNLEIRFVFIRCSHSEWVSLLYCSLPRKHPVGSLGIQRTSLNVSQTHIQIKQWQRMYRIWAESPSQWVQPNQHYGCSFQSSLVSA